MCQAGNTHAAAHVLLPTMLLISAVWSYLRRLTSSKASAQSPAFVNMQLLQSISSKAPAL
jgi:hypothetical protein